MRRVRIAFLVASIACALAAAAPACKTPAQVTLDIGITNAKCQKDVRNTAITVGVDPHETETNLANGYVTATTSDCDVGSGHVGTLVVTPNDDMHASIIVTAAFGGGDSSTCRPPDYEHCVVARRRFAFVEHQKLTLPIALDVSCVDVPCDEVSTCKNGQCVDSTVQPSGDAYGEPSVPHDAGGGNGGDSGANDGGTEGGAGDSGADGGPTFPACEADGLHCANKTTGGDTICNGTATPCCDSTGGVATCGGACAANDTGWCCAPTDCKTPGFVCSRDPAKGGPPGKCVGLTTCAAGALYCNGKQCQPTEGCCATPSSTTPTCSADCVTTPGCCGTPNCTPVGGSCPMLVGSTPQTCEGGTPLQPSPPSCDGTGHLTCEGQACDKPGHACCLPTDGGAAYCTPSSCAAGEAQDCCPNGGNQCTSPQTCSSISINGGMNLLPITPLGAGVVGGGGGVSTCR